jgi:putative transposase
LLRREPRRDLFLGILEQVRRSDRFVVAGYVVMPEHVHLLISEPERANPGTVIQALKQRFARAVLRELRGHCVPRRPSLSSGPLTQSHIWQARFYDFLVYTKKKRMEKLHYMHRNPVARGLVLEPEQWAWSSVRDYVSDERGRVLVNEQVRAEMKVVRSLRMTPQWRGEWFRPREDRSKPSAVGSRNPRPSNTAKTGAASVG